MWVAHNNEHYQRDRASHNSNTSNNNDTTNMEASAVNCKHCRKRERTKPHPVHVPVDKCMWNKVAIVYRFENVCKKMKL